MTNLRLTNRTREAGGDTYCEPGNATHLIYSAAVLAEYRTTEPKADWHYETRGTDTAWHRVKDGPLA